MTFLNRRSLIGAGAALGLSGALPAVAQQSYSPVDLAEAGPLGDKILGNSLAPVTCIEYASLTCGHCAAFHETGFKFLKDKYIDAGKLRFILRDFPLDPLSAAGFMLSHCAGEGKYYPMVDLLFSQQKTWTQTDKPVDALLSLARQAGFSQESFEVCLKNQTMYEGVNAVRKRGSEKFGVDSTPTFFFNGRKATGNLTVQQLEAIIEPLLKS
ncbi:MAG: DsbA family protein [Beijerinckiaceae bacterium]